MLKTYDVIVGWDIGGVQSKCACISGDFAFLSSKDMTFEIWKDPGKLSTVLEYLASDIPLSDTAMAITMTAELSDCFTTKAEGVRFVLEAFIDTFPGIQLMCLGTNERWVPVEKAMGDPINFAATNWIAAAREMARSIGDGIWIDVGSTTTDIIPIKENALYVRGRNDTDRLRFGELVYTGLIRSNPNALASRLPFKGDWYRTSNEYFALMGDCYLLLGEIDPEDYSCTPPDSGSVNTEGAARRLARLICADASLAKPEDLLPLAGYLRERQIGLIVDALYQVCSEPHVKGPAAVTGAGQFLGIQAALRTNLSILNAEAIIPDVVKKHFPAYAAAKDLAIYLSCLSKS